MIIVMCSSVSPALLKRRVEIPEASTANIIALQESSVSGHPDSRSAWGVSSSVTATRIDGVSVRGGGSSCGIRYVDVGRKFEHGWKRVWKKRRRKKVA